MNILFRASAWLCVMWAFFVIRTSRQSVPRCGVTPRDAAPRRPRFGHSFNQHRNGGLIMTTINLKDFYYWYTQDQFIPVRHEQAGDHLLLE